MHYRKFQINHQPDATIFQFIILTFIYSWTCFGRSSIHHQELNDCSNSLWFLPSYRGDSRAVFVVVSDHEHSTVVTTIRRWKPEAVTAVIELLMVGGRMPKTCWDVNKRQDNKLENWCIWLVIYLKNRILLFTWKSKENHEGPQPGYRVPRPIFRTGHVLISAANLRVKYVGEFSENSFWCRGYEWVQLHKQLRVVLSLRIIAAAETTLSTALVKDECGYASNALYTFMYCRDANGRRTGLITFCVETAFYNGLLKEG